MKSLDQALAATIEDCTECGSCVRHCAFLQRFGTPSSLANQYRSGTLESAAVYSCSLCRLCDVACPEGLQPSALFWLMRCQLVERGKAPLKQHRRILAYEKWGLSRWFRLTVLPEGTDKVFFPGCALAGTRPHLVEWLYGLLREIGDNIGIALNCCAKPSHDLGRTVYFDNVFGPLLETFRKSGVRKIVTACPSCHQIFSRYGTDFELTSVYEVLASSPVAPRLGTPETLTIHDPCATRFDESVQQSVRNLAASMGGTITEMRHRQKRTFCCGEGGSACFVAPDLTSEWARRRAKQTDNKKVLTYCAGCVQFLSKRMDTVHLLDLLYDPDSALAGRLKPATTPLTYINRMRLKHRLQQGNG